MRNRCENTRFQPLLVVFTNGGGLPVSTLNAPKTTEFVSKEMLLTVKPPTKTPSQRNKQKRHHHHRKHKKNRSTSNSPLQSPNKTGHSERVHSRSSNSSQSPTSPVRHSHKKPVSTTHTEPTVASENKSSENFTLEKTKFNSSSEDLRQSSDSYSRPPKALMRNSASDGSIAENQDDHGNVRNLASSRKRSGSMKLKLGNMFKIKNPMYRSMKATKSTSSADETDSVKSQNEVGKFADVGYSSPYNKRNNSKVETADDNLSLHPQNGPPQQPDNGKKENDSGIPAFKQQLKALELHKEILSQQNTGSKAHHDNMENEGHHAKSAHNHERTRYNEDSISAVQNEHGKVVLGYNFAGKNRFSLFIDINPILWRKSTSVCARNSNFFKLQYFLLFINPFCAT